MPVMYRFYKKPSKDDADEYNFSVEDRYPLYALTTDKFMCKKFKKERDMNKFIYRKDSVSREEYAEYANKNRGKVLTLQTLTTAVNKNTNDQIIKNVLVLLTQDEYTTTKEFIIPIEDEGWWMNTTSLIDINAISSKLYKSLEFVDFILMHKLFSGVDIEDDDYYSWAKDELTFFVDVYGDTFK